MSGLRFVRRAVALGLPVAIVNQGPTRGDPLADVKVEAPLGTAGLVLDARLAKAVALNREATAIITLGNSGRTASSSATVRAVIPDGVDLVRTDPPRCLGRAERDRRRHDDTHR